MCRNSPTGRNGNRVGNDNTGTGNAGNKVGNGNKNGFNGNDVGNRNSGSGNTGNLVSKTVANSIRPPQPLNCTMFSTLRDQDCLMNSVYPTNVFDLCTPVVMDLNVTKASGLIQSIHVK